MTIQDLQAGTIEVPSLNPRGFARYQAAVGALNAGDRMTAAEFLRGELDRHPAVHLRMFFAVGR